MIVTLIERDKIHSLTLPENANGRYWLGQGLYAIAIEAHGGQWGVCSGPDAEVLAENGGKAAWQPLEIQSIYTIMFVRSGSRAQLLVEPVTEDRQRYTRYHMPENFAIHIGRKDGHEIAVNNKFVSSNHATLLRTAEGWQIGDEESLNGTFVNGSRTKSGGLRPGDIVFIMGLKIIIGLDYFAINNPDGSVVIKKSALSACKGGGRGRSATRAAVAERHLFYRSPRFMRRSGDEKITVDGPPEPQKVEETQLALLLGPAITMGMTAVVMAMVAVNGLMSGESKLTSALPTLAMSFSMLCGTVLWPTLTRRADRRRKKAAEHSRRDKYRKYLDNIREELFGIAIRQKKIISENSPDLVELARRVALRQRNLWERSPGHGDFLSVRLGLGTLPLAADVKFPAERFSVDEDYLRNELLRLAGEPRVLEDVPVCHSLTDDPVIGIAGADGSAAALAHDLLLQIAALHGYDCVRIAIFADADLGARLGPIRYLPHLWDEPAGIRLFGVAADEHKAISSHLERVLDERLEKAEEREPHYVVLCTGKELAEKTGIVQQLLKKRTETGFSLICLAAQMRELPKECSKVVEIAEGLLFVSANGDLSGVRQQVRPDDNSGIDTGEMAVQIANIELNLPSEAQKLPSVITFTEMYGVGKIEHLNALTRWKDNNPTNSLQAQIGVDSDGSLMYLDLHEKFHGPHGLIAGMTGSGKSEFIITFILSLAVNYHPHEVAFILIDYKGGGLAGAFEDEKAGVRLPHLSGTVTNLDGSAIKRSLVSIQSELRRRQAIFNRARQAANEGTVDIYKYQRMYRNGQVSEPVPHLFIISDEFAEFKSQQPEFMEQLISTARIGRSLGIHLILATQKPSGVVDDQIWSNSRFRISLKVQEKADSMDMIKRPDAASLVETGRFYMQVGYNEIFEMGQSAWCGAPYTPSDTVEKAEEKAVVFIDNVGRAIAEYPVRAAENRETKAVPQVTAIVKYLSEIARGENVAAPQLWLPAIPEDITIDRLAEKYGYNADRYRLAPVVGEYDDPANQKQGLVVLPLSDIGNLALFGSVGSGKTTFITSMLYSLLASYDARQLNVYIIDLGEETLRVFEEAPQVGGVLFSGDGEKLRNLLKMLVEEMAVRRKRFADYEGSLLTYCEKTGEAVPQIVVVLRNYSAFSEQFEEEEEAFYQLSRDGGKYGIYFVVAANSASAIRYRMMQNFKQIIALQLNDRSDYIGLFGSTDGLYPAKLKGRGMMRTDKIYEFQTAAVAEGGATDGVRDFCNRLKESSPFRAKAVPVLPEAFTARDISGQELNLKALPMGIDKQSLRYIKVNLLDRVVYPVVAESAEGTACCARAMARLLTRINGMPVTVLDGARLFAGFECASCAVVDGEFENPVRALFDRMVERNRAYKQPQGDSGGKAFFAAEVYIITGIEYIFAALSEDGKDKLRVLIDKAEPAYNIHLILCDSAKGMSAVSMEAWYRRHVSASEGIWIGDGFGEQYILKAGKQSGGLFRSVNEGFGYIVRRGKAVHALLLSDPAGDGDEDE